MNKHEAALILERIADDNGLYGNPELSQDAIKAIYMGMDALEGRKKKPINEDRGNMTMHYCGNCRRSLCASIKGKKEAWKEATHFCSWCGTKIDWEE